MNLRERRRQMFMTPEEIERERRRQMVMTPEEIERDRAESVLLQRPHHESIASRCLIAWMEFALDYSDVLKLPASDAFLRSVLCDYIEERASSDSSLLLLTKAIRWADGYGSHPYLAFGRRHGKWVELGWMLVNESANTERGRGWASIASRSKIPWRLFDASRDWRRETIRRSNLFSLYAWLAASIECLHRCGRDPHGYLLREMRPTLFPQEV